MEAEARAGGEQGERWRRQGEEKEGERGDGSEWAGRVWTGGGVFSKNVTRAVFCKNDKSSRFSLLPVEIKFTAGIYSKIL